MNNIKIEDYLKESAIILSIAGLILYITLLIWPEIYLESVVPKLWQGLSFIWGINICILWCIIFITRHST